jgi:hypothetical protein
MANTLLTISMITREAMAILENALVFTGRVNREYDSKFAVAGAKIGNVLNIRKPPRYIGRRGQALQIENAEETSVPLRLNTQYGCDIQFSSQDLALSIDDFSERFIKPAIATVANAIDYDGLQLYKNVYNAVGAAGTTPTSVLTYLQAGVTLDDGAAPLDDLRFLVTTPMMQATLISNTTTVFNPQAAISEQYRTGRYGRRVLGFDWYMDQNCPSHTGGALGGTPLMNGATLEGATSLVTNGWTSAAATRVKQGDVFTVGTVKRVNPMSRQSTGALQQFVATADGVSDGSGNMTIAIDPAIYSSGQKQTVTAVPATSNALTFAASASLAYRQGLAGHRDAFAFATADLPLPGGVDMAARVSDKQLGVSMRLIRAYDTQTDQFPCRIDVLGGWATLRPELACRILSLL